MCWNPTTCGISNSPLSSNRKPQPHLPKKISMEGLLICFCEDPFFLCQTCKVLIWATSQQHLRNRSSPQIWGLCSKERKVTQSGRKGLSFSPRRCDRSITVTLSSPLTEASLSFWAKESKQRSKNYFQQCHYEFLLALNPSGDKGWKRVCLPSTSHQLSLICQEKGGPSSFWQSWPRKLFTSK